MSAKSDADLVSALIGADFVVPAVGIGLPVLGVLITCIVDVVKAEIVTTAPVFGLLVNTAAFLRGSLSIYLVQDTTNITHGTVLVIGVLGVVVDHDVFHGISALLSFSTARESIVVAQSLIIKSLSSWVKFRCLAHCILELHGGG